MSPDDPVEVTPRSLRDWPLPAAGSSKYLRGRVLVIGGAASSPGAVQLAGLAALRVGGGHLSLAVAAAAAVPLAVATPEAGVTALPTDDAGSVLPDGIRLLERSLRDVDAVVLGPGLDAPGLTLEVVSRVVAMTGPDVALVIDAFALGALADLPKLPDHLAARAVLTPNDGEAELLLQRPLSPEVLPDVAEIASRYGTVVACHDVIAHPDGRCWRVSTGHSGLATSGSGDVLAGALGGLLARGAEPAQAACWAKYLHAAAGERLAARIGRLGFLAREIVEELPQVLSELG
ncbi:MAG: NAD(P)H-hydrate dehydratase [Propionibacteriaceae bacterium]|nr:NAD(P)H-hydrate dehydratase [Propionibacteriaceae bacterium]